MDRLKAEKETPALEVEYETWKSNAARFVAVHLGDAFTQRFIPSPYEPPTGTPTAVSQIRMALEPLGIYNKTRAKVDALERFKNEL
jgi:hypothetical protein